MVEEGLDIALRYFFHFHFFQGRASAGEPTRQFAKLIVDPEELISLNSEKKQIPAYQVIAVVDWRRETLGRDFLAEYRELAKNFMSQNQNFFNFLIVDMGNKKMFEYLADTYGIGNFESPGIFATHGERFYYRNYERYEDPESFKRIGWNFLNNL